ncbi:MAG: efflux RND transporter periplasmic adaptor subunit [Verrucomicrobia bacterium]|nr:efflux RND transporter periplasmic adaptor subunit [Verrucomicrobiota bacterium]
MSSLVMTPTATTALASVTRFAARLTLAAALIAAAVLYTHAAETPAAPPAPKVTVAAVEQKLLADYEEITGRVDATETVELRARVSGHLDAVNFQAGQLVQKGDVLFTIDPRWYQAQFDLASARASVALSEAKRADELLAGAAISNEEAEARRARAAEARAALATAQLDLEYTQVRAPIAGRVGRALITAGNLVAGSPGNATLLTTIVSTGDAFVYADIDEGTYLKFSRLARENRLAAAGARVPVELQLADETGYPRHGYIESTDNRVNPSTGSLTLRMVFPNADQALVPGLYARVRVPIGAPQPTLLVSERAIGTDQSQKFVLSVASDRTATYRTVKLGGTVEGKRIVRSGLSAGDQVIVNGLQRVRPGMTVQPEVAVAATPLVPPAGTAVAAR